MGKRCELTDLLEDHCAHCQGHLKRERERPSRPFPASFPGPCGNLDFIDEGDEIVMHEGQAWHVECARDAGILSDDEDEDEVDDFFG